jgi:CHAT domain-containing protein/Tfp pilus assembly protein PilF
MKRKHLFFLYTLLSLASSLSAQNFPTGQNTIKNGKRDGDWILWLNAKRNSTTISDSVIYYRMISYAEGKPVGMVKDFYRNGKLQWQGHLITDNPGDVIDGSSVSYYENGQKEEEAEFKDGSEIQITKYSKDGQKDELGTVLGQAGIWHEEGSYEKAEKLYLQSLGLAEIRWGKSHEEYATILNSVALLYYDMGHYDQAEPLYLQALVIEKTRLGDSSVIYAESLDNLAVLYGDKGQYDKAAPLHLQALAIYKRRLGENSADYATSLNYLARLYFSTGRFEKAEPLFLKILEIRKTLLGESNPDYAISLNNLGVFYEELSRYEEAEPLYLSAVNILKKHQGEEHPNYATYLNNLAKLYAEMGRFEKAEPLYTKSLEIRKRQLGENHPDYADALNGMAVLYVSMGRLERAEALYLQAMNIRKEILGKDHPRYANSLNNLAALYERMGKYSKSEAFYVEALAIYKLKLGENHPRYANALNNLATLYSERGWYEKAEPIFQKALAIRKATLKVNSPPYASSLMGLANLNRAIGHTEQAEKLYLTALDIMKRRLGETHPDYANGLKELAYLYESKKQFEKSDLFIKQSVKDNILLIERVFPALSEKEKEQLYQIISGTFEYFNAYCNIRSTQNPDIAIEMYDLQLFAKSILLNSSAKWKQRIRTSGDKKLFALYTVWERNQGAIARLYHEPDSVKRKGLDSILRQNDVLEKELSQRSELFARLSDKKRNTWQEIQRKLKPGEAAIEVIRCKKYGVIKMVTDSSNAALPSYPRYGLTDTVYYSVLVVTQFSKKPEVVILRNGNDLEKRGLQFYRNNINLQQRDEGSYSLYWKPIADALGKKIKKVYFSPDGAYHSINLNTLYNPATKKYLIDETDVQILTNTKDLLAVNNEESFNNVAYLFGHPSYNSSKEKRTLPAGKERGTPPVYYELNLPTRFELSDLPGTQQEIDAIEPMLTSKGWQAEVFTGDEALEENLKDCFKPRILHIATHGYFQPDSARSNPLLQSGLMLAGAARTLRGDKDDTSEDGILTAYEAVNLNLDNTDLVVLSACETGLGEVRNGEGVYGLQRAFKVAGARSIIMSLWKVNDESTQELLIEFYKFWLAGGDKRQSLKDAQLEIRKKYPHPYFWGAFVMVGE